METTKIIDALARFNEVWSEVTGNVDKEEVSAKAYDAIFEVEMLS